MDTTEKFDLAVHQLRDLLGSFREAAARCEVSENEFWIWYSLIVLESAMTQQEICVTWSLHKQTVNTIVSGMVKRGYAVLEAIPGTRNHKRIRLTAQGRSYGEGLVAPAFDAERRAFDSMTQEDQRDFLRILSTYGGLLRREMERLP